MNLEHFYLSYLKHKFLNLKIKNLELNYYLLIQIKIKQPQILMSEKLIKNLNLET